MISDIEIVTDKHMEMMNARWTEEQSKVGVSSEAPPQPLSLTGGLQSKLSKCIIL
jgi:hypothetical protein